MPNQDRRRRAATVLVFVAGLIATAATSSSYTRIDVPGASATVRLDADHATSMTPFVVRVSQEASSGSMGTGLQFWVGDVRAVPGSPASTSASPASTGAPGAGSPGAGSAGPAGSRGPAGSPAGKPAEVTRPPVVAPGPVPEVHLLLLSAVATLPVSPAVATDELPAVPLPSPWQVEAQPQAGSSIPLPISCGDGPCERAFWLVAQLADVEAGAVEIDWRVSGELHYGGDWPSGASATVEIGESLTPAGAAPMLGVSTETESVVLDATRPAAARVVEVSIGGEAIPADGRQVAALRVNVAYAAGSNGSGSSLPFVEVIPLDPPAAGAGSAPPSSSAGPDAGPAVLPPEGDPFAGCPVGKPCTRRFLVNLAVPGAIAAATGFDWSVSVRRADVAAAWSTPATLSARVTRRFDVDPAQPPSTIHRDGAFTAVEGIGESQVVLDLATSTTSTDPVARLLPVPAALAYHLDPALPQPSGNEPRTEVGVSLQGEVPARGTGRLASTMGVGPFDITGSPTAIGNAICRIGEICPRLSIQVTPYSPGASAGRVHVSWSLDVSVFSYEEIPVTLSATDVR